MQGAWEDGKSVYKENWTNRRGGNTGSPGTGTIQKKEAAGWWSPSVLWRGARLGSSEAVAAQCECLLAANKVGELGKARGESELCFCLLKTRSCDENPVKDGPVSGAAMS